ncbi:fluoride efflux transporter CrcB, partial [Escherichia coli]|nr:fluoride efflux transporter CrcB [Escherichia coli]
MARWLLSMRFNPLHQAIPLGTLAANLIGAFIIGMGFAWFSRMTNIDPVWTVCITTGLYGGIRNLSTLSSVWVIVFTECRYVWALLHVVIHLLCTIVVTDM